MAATRATRHHSASTLQRPRPPHRRLVRPPFSSWSDLVGIGKSFYLWNQPGPSPKSQPIFALRAAAAARDRAPSTMASPRDPARLRQGLNPLTTSALGSLASQQHGTPISAVSMASSHAQSAHTPASAIQPYNPQEWVPPGAPPMPERQVQYAAEAQGTSLVQAASLLPEFSVNRPNSLSAASTSV